MICKLILRNWSKINPVAILVGKALCKMFKFSIYCDVSANILCIFHLQGIAKEPILALACPDKAIFPKQGLSMQPAERASSSLNLTQEVFSNIFQPLYVILIQLHLLTWKKSSQISKIGWFAKILDRISLK